ncbi:hypothetical protein A4X13_0g2972 [Tilletia indica]|uniref:Uncharacterized protein n=1 Tax=Tilletia indica TaxID=43049 RepID=A0A177TCY6_9BASI|nr:hypothetical protein A4X13_0g2972 [Tilletia indica]
MYAAPYDDDEQETEGERGPRGCLALLPTPTWAEINLVPVLQAREREAGMEKVVVEKKKRARRKGRAPESPPPPPPAEGEGKDEVGVGEEEEGGDRPNKRARVDTTISTTRARSTGRTRAPAKKGTTSSTPAEVDPPDDAEDSSSSEEETTTAAPTTRRRSRLRSKWKRPKPLTDPVEIAAAALATQRLLEGCSGTVKVHPDEGRVLISRELFEGVVVKMAGLVPRFLGEDDVGEDGVGLEDEVIFVLREMLCLDQGKEDRLQQTGIFRLLVGHTPSPTTHSNDTSTAVRTFFGPLWYSSTTFTSKMTKDVPEYIGGYLSLHIVHPTHTFHLALSRADALRLTISERTDTGSSDSEFVGICEMMLRERARREAFGLAPCFDEGGGKGEEGGLMMLASSEEDGEEGWEVVGVPELWVDRALLVQAERRAVEMIGSSSSSSSSGPTEIGKGERGTAFSKDAMDFVKMFSFGTSLADDGGKFVRVPKSCLSEARLYVDSVLGARAKGAVSVSDAMMEMEGVRLESEEEDEEEGEEGEEIEVLDEPEVEVPREVDEVSPELEPEREPSPEPVQEAVQGSTSTSTSTSIPGSSMMLALPGLGQPSRLHIAPEPVKKAKPKKKAVISIPKKIEKEKGARTAVSLGELEDELEGVLVEARRRTVKALRV